MIEITNMIYAGVSSPKMVMTEIADGLFLVLVVVAIVFSVRYGGRVAARHQVRRLWGMLTAGILCLILGGGAMIAIHVAVFRHL